VKSSMKLILLGIFAYSLSATALLWAGDAGDLTLEADGGKTVEFTSFHWGDGSTGIPGAAAVSGGQIHSITVKRKPDETSAFLAAAHSAKRAIPSASLQLPASGGGAASTVTLHNVMVVSIEAAGGTTDKAAASELVKLGFESMEVSR